MAGPLGTAAGAAAGALWSSPKGRKIMVFGGGAVVLSSIAVPLLVVLLVVNGIAGVISATDAGATERSADVAMEDGITEAQVEHAMQMVEGTDVPWEVLAAIPHVLNTDPTEPPRAYTGAERAKGIKDDEPLGAYGVLHDPATQYAQRKSLRALTFDQATEPVPSGTFLAAGLSDHLSSNNVEGLDLDSGAVQVEGEDPDEIYLMMGEEDSETAAAEAAKELFVDAISELPIEDAESRAEQIFQIAHTWRVGGAQECDIGAGTASAPSSVDGIPQASLDAYVAAAEKTGVPWYYLAGVGWVETQHGTYGGSVVDEKGNSRPKIIGIALNGSNGTMAIRDTDNGRLDNDKTWDRAVGPMQFIPSTWATRAADGNLDGESDPHNMFDAALSAAQYLKASGAPGDMKAALYAYNRSDAYRIDVLAKAQEYKNAPAAPDNEQASTPVAPTDNAKPTGKVKDDNADAATESSTGAWMMPVLDATKTSAVFGQPGSYWSSGYHTGTDFLGPSGDPIFASNAGTVTVSPNGSYGPYFVIISHGTIDGKRVDTRYAHMSSISVRTGDRVTAGQQIGGMGALGNVSSPTAYHLHFEVEVDGSFVDPLVFLSTAGSPIGGTGASCGGGIVATNGDGSWGGHQNGKIPADALSPLAFSPSVLLRADAARALERLNDAYKKRFGCDVGPVGGYRSYEDQVSLYAQKPGLAAKPGTSNHGWGLAADLSGDCDGNGAGINVFGTPEHQWMATNAGGYGWVLPQWAQQGGSKPEPWHWEFGIGA